MNTDQKLVEVMQESVKGHFPITSKDGSYELYITKLTYNKENRTVYAIGKLTNKTLNEYYWNEFKFIELKDSYFEGFVEEAMKSLVSNLESKLNQQTK